MRVPELKYQKEKEEEEEEKMQWEKKGKFLFIVYNFREIFEAHIYIFEQK